MLIQANPELISKTAQREALHTWKHPSSIRDASITAYGTQLQQHGYCSMATAAWQWLGGVGLQHVVAACDGSVRWQRVVAACGGSV